MFSFVTDAGSVTLSGGTLGGNSATLDLKLSLYTSTGALVASADTSSLGESLTVNLPGGSYRLAVASHGSYGDVGQYTISGTVITPTNIVAAPTNLVASSSGSGVNLTWSDNSTNEDQFTLSRSTDPTFPAAGTTTFALPSNTTSYADSGLTNGVTYYYRVVASNASSTSDASNTASATIVPTAPVLNSAAAVSSTQVNLAWTDVIGETGYQIQKSTDQSNWLSAGSAAANATSLSVTGLNGSTTYYFRVLATNAGGSSSPSNVLSATTSAPPALPAAPSGLLATAISGTRVGLTWTDNAATETGFYIERSNNGGKSYSQIATVGANSVAWTDTTVTKRKTYQYRIRAYNGTGVSAYSNVAVVTTPNAAPGSTLLSDAVAGSDDDLG
jgi:titin